VIDFYEIIGLLAACITTASFLPQVFKTYKTKDTSGLSLTMYIAFFIGIVLWNSFKQFANDFSELYHCNFIFISNNYEIKA
jgi:MtN3 and saliva related transmembrane protein